MAYYCNKNQKHYTYIELLAHVHDVKKKFPKTTGEIRRGRVELLLHLKPTENSIEYTVKLLARQGCKSVKIFVVNPHVGLVENGKKVPHLYSDGSLCLYYPKNHEWSFSDEWSDTLIPWISLWLYYYEAWRETGLWLGGGIHGKKTIPPL